MLSVNSQDIQGDTLGEDVNGVLGPGVQVVVVAVVLHDEAVDVDAAVVLVNMQLEARDDRCHGHCSSSL